MKISVRKKLTLSQRFVRRTFFLGIPLVCLDLLGKPVSSWPSALAIGLPVALTFALIFSILEHMLITFLANKSS